MTVQTKWISSAMIAAACVTAPLSAQDNAEQTTTVVARKAVGTLSSDANSSTTKSDDSMKLLQTYLQDSDGVCQTVTSYTAVLQKHVLVDGEMVGPQTIELKVREQPFAVYMKWSDSDQEALYAEGENDNKVIAHLESGLASLRDRWELDPESERAMSGCRYPITQAGLTNMSNRIGKFYSSLADAEDFTCSHREVVVDGQPLLVFDVEFHTQSADHELAHGKIYFDAVTKCIAGVENYGWNGATRGELTEKYVYGKVNLDAQLTDSDFDIENPEYGF